MECPPYNFINILATSFYPDWSRKCQRSITTPQKCLSSEEVKLRFEACNGQNKCTIDLINTAIIPCSATPMIFEGTYACRAPFLITICQFSTGEIRCLDGSKIEIVSSFYGRKSRDTCRSQQSHENQEFYRNVECQAQNSFRVIQEKCNGKMNCTLTASDEEFEDPCPGILKYLEVNFVCKANLVESAPLQTKNEIVLRDAESVQNSEKVCPYSSSIINCPDRNQINILTTTLKSSSIMSCPPNQQTKTHHSINCLSLEKLSETVKKKCNKKTGCYLGFQTITFGDMESCSLANKYLEIDYTCEGHKGIIFCRNSEGRINCESNEVIKIHDALYGRIDSNMCKPFGLISDESKYQNTNCRADGVKKKISQLCEGNQSCHVQASKEIYGDACEDTFKYLEIDYYCLVLLSQDDSPDPLRVRNEVIHRKMLTHQGFAFICSQSQSSLDCMDNFKIMMVVRVEIIPFDSNECPAEISRKSKDKCNNLNDISRTIYACKGKKNCLLDISNIVFRETCDSFSSSPEMIIAEYICGGHKGIIFCGNSEGDINCERNEVIQIHDALYGRIDSNMCKSFGLISDESKYQNTNCRADGVKKKISQLCDGKQSCHVQASEEIYGDTCEDTYKYLEIDYYCVGN